MRKKYIVQLTVAEREALTTLVSTGTAAAYRIKHANILLTADVAGPAWRDARIAEAFGCHERTVENVRRRCVLKGLEAALARKPQVRPSRRPILDGAGEAHLIAVACSAPPEGRARWTLHLLADALVRLDVVESISVPTVRRVLKKTRCSPIARRTG